MSGRRAKEERKEAAQPVIVVERERMIFRVEGHEYIVGLKELLESGDPVAALAWASYFELATIKQLLTHQARQFAALAAARGIRIPTAGDVREFGGARG